MSLVLFLLALLLAGCVSGSDLASFPGTAPATGSSEVANYAFLNGRWFDGTGFEAATWYSVQGRLTRNPPLGRLEVVDLSGLFIVPPFGEAHNHNVEGPWNLRTVSDRYFKDGVFYVKIPNNVREFALQIRDRLNLPASLDVAFAHAGLTGRSGHPIGLYEDVLRRNRYEQAIGPVERGWFENRAYVVVETEHDVAEKWALIISGRPDFLKVYLVHSEDDGPDRQPGHAIARTGLRPQLLPHIVAKAHAAGLQVTAHVETAADFRHTVRAGVDEVAHVPGWLVQQAGDAAGARLTEEDARLAAERKVRVVTTAAAGQSMPAAGTHHGQPHHEAPTSQQADRGEPLSVELGRQVVKDNLTLLHRAGVRLAIGSDHADTSLDEVLYLRSLQVFDDLTLLNLWCDETPAAIFPGRKIGRFEEGYEASFLALGGNPLDEFTQVRAIRRRFKQGVPLDDRIGGDAVPTGSGQGISHR
jgi:imidazolonepropionase-like amidohydrolase